MWDTLLFRERASIVREDCGSREACGGHGGHGGRGGRGGRDCRDAAL